LSPATGEEVEAERENFRPALPIWKTLREISFSLLLPLATTFWLFKPDSCEFLRRLEVVSLGRFPFFTSPGVKGLRLPHLKLSLVVALALAECLVFFPFPQR